MSGADAAGWPRLSRALYSMALAMFVITVAIGILNGLDLVDFSPPEMRNTLLTHVHAGTLGWITLAIMASAFWLAGSGDRALAWTFAIVVPVYVLAFYSGNYPARALTGTLLLLAILWLLVWAWRVAMAQRSLPALALALGLTTFAYGAVIGVLLQVQGALATNLFPANGDAIGAHAATMVFSYLILIAMGLIEWRLMGLTPRSGGGLVQVGALFGGGLILAVTLLLLDQSAVQAVGGIYLLVELVAVGFFARRVLPHALRSDWRSGTPSRHIAMAAVFVIIATAIFLYVVFLFISTGDPNKIPTGVLVASDHAAFIGVMTNLIFGLALGLAADRQDRWPWAGQVVFWAVNLGLAIFLLGLIAASPELKRIGSPIMGIGILVGLATIALRLWSSDLSAAQEGATS